MSAGSINKVILIGNLGKDPEIRATQDGREIANLTLATSDQWTDKNSGEKRERTEWHRIAIFNPGLVGLCKKYLNKGSKIYIEGQLQTRKWQDNSGMERYTTEVVLQGYNGVLTFLDKIGGANDYSSSNDMGSAPAAASSGAAAAAAPAHVSEELDDEIPF